jgi:hypothetical protein
MTTCFDCEFRNIHETEHEWIECHCKKDGHWHNPYRPMRIIKDCPNWQRIGEEHDKETETR